MRVLSLFSGCGGLDLGFESAGFDIVGAYEANPSAVKTYNNNLSPVCTEATLHPGFELSEAVDLVVAGPPCQGFSTASGYGRDDDRNSLLGVACQLALKLKPRLILVENVAGLTNAKNNGFMKAAVDLLVQAGYHVEQALLECENFGVAQRRRRLFLIARSHNRHFKIDMTPYRAPVPKVSDVLAGLQVGENNHHPKHLKAGSLDFEVAARIGQGQKLCNVRSGEKCVHSWDIPAAFGVTTDDEKSILRSIQRIRRQERRRDFGDADPVTPQRLREVYPEADSLISSLLDKKYLRHVGDHVDLTQTFNGKYRRLEGDGVSPTVDTRFGDSRLFLHPIEHRGLTVREAARLQGFPDNFKLPDSDRDSFRQVGNAVPPPVAKIMAEFVAHLI